jgi:hypothetical protein
VETVDTVEGILTFAADESELRRKPKRRLEEELEFRI